MARTLFDKADEDLMQAKGLYKLFTQENDERYLTGLAYHLQQAIEKTIKFILENHGVKYEFEHTLDYLISLSEAKSVDLYLSDYIKNNSGKISYWEASSRYLIDFYVTANDLVATLNEVESYMKIVQEKEIGTDKEINEQLLSELEKSKKKKI